MRKLRSVFYKIKYKINRYIFLLTIGISILSFPFIMISISMILSSNDVFDIIQFTAKDKWNISIDSNTSILRASDIFTGLMAFAGVLISIFGIYWQMKRTEKNKRIETLTRELDDLDEIKAIFMEFCIKNKEKYSNSFYKTPIFIERILEERLNVEKIKDNVLDSILNKDKLSNFFDLIDENSLIDKKLMLYKYGFGHSFFTFNDNLKKILDLISSEFNDSYFIQIEDNINKLPDFQLSQENKEHNKTLVEISCNELLILKKILEENYINKEMHKKTIEVLDKYAVHYIHYKEALSKYDKYRQRIIFFRHVILQITEKIRQHIIKMDLHVYEEYYKIIDTIADILLNMDNSLLTLGQELDLLSTSIDTQVTMINKEIAIRLLELNKHY